MKFEIKAVIAEIGQIESVGQNGFQKRNLILTETNGEYVNPVCIEWSGEKLTRPESHQIGQMVKVSGFINCRKWEDKYFVSLAGSYIENVDTGQQVPQQPAFGSQQAIAQPAQQPVYNQPVAQPQTPAYAQPQPAPPQQPPQQVYNANMAPPVLNQPVSQPQFNPNAPQDDTVF